MSVTSDVSDAALTGQLAWSERVFRLLATVWCGSQWTVGYLVAPILFATLNDRTVAGTLAGAMFRAEAWLGVICGAILLPMANRFGRRAGLITATGRNHYYRRLRWIVAGMLVCVALGYFALQPWMNEFRRLAEAAGTDVGHSAYATNFGILHGVSSVFYGVQSLLGLILIWRLAARA